MSLARVSGRISIFSRPCIMRWLRWRGLLEPNITLSAGAVIARRGSNYAQLAKTADAALYQAKTTHDGGFAHA